MVTGILDARGTETLVGKDLVVITQENRQPISWMKDAQIFGFVPRNYSIHGSIVSCGDSVECFSLLNLMDHFLAGKSGRGLRGTLRNNESFADRQAIGCEAIPGL